MVIRHPLPTDSLTPVFGELDKMSWNSEQVYVVEEAGEIVAGVILWDGGHDIVQATNMFVVPHRRGSLVAKCLWNRIVDDLKAAGKKALLGFTANLQVAYFAQKHGGLVGPPHHMVWWTLN